MGYRLWVSQNKPFLPLDLLDELPPGNPTLKLVTIMQASGHTIEEIAKVTGLAPSSIRAAMSAPKVQEFSSKFSNYFLNNSPMARFNDLVGEAIQTVAELMRDGQKEAVRLKAAGMILDRALGTALQRVEVTEESTVKQLLDHLSRNSTITTTGTKIVTLTPDNDELILDDFQEVNETGSIEAVKGDSHDSEHKV